MAVVRFCERTRGAPSLHRGWRTPDPSPTRTAKNLPAISLDLCVAEEEDEKWPCTTGGAYSEQKASQPFYDKRCDYANQQDPPYGTHDGVSTPRGHKPSSPCGRDFPLPNGGAWPNPPTYYEPRVRTPSPEHTYARTHEFYPPPPCPPTCLPRNTLATVPMPMVWAYNKGGVQGGCTGPATFNVAGRPDTFNVAGSMSQGIFQPYVKQEPCRSGYYGQKQAPVQAPVQELGWVVSRGSIGHPFSCGKACKYVKKRKGCKDGASCDHCHICDWHRCEAATRKYRADGHGAGI